MFSVKRENPRVLNALPFIIITENLNGNDGQLLFSFRSGRSSSSIELFIGCLRRHWRSPSASLLNFTESNRRQQWPIAFADDQNYRATARNVGIHFSSEFRLSSLAIDLHSNRCAIMGTIPEKRCHNLGKIQQKNVKQNEIERRVTRDER